MDRYEKPFVDYDNVNSNFGEYYELRLNADRLAIRLIEELARAGFTIVPIEELHGKD